MDLSKIKNISLPVKVLGGLIMCVATYATNIARNEYKRETDKMELKEFFKETIQEFKDKQDDRDDDQDIKMMNFYNQQSIDGMRINNLQNQINGKNN